MSRHVADMATRVRDSKTFRLTDAESTTPHSVYGIYDASDHLLYVGCASDVVTRLSLHMQPSSQSLTSHIIQRHAAYYTAREYPTKADARQAERHAIAALSPALNKQHNPEFNSSLYEHLATTRTRDQWGSWEIEHRTA